MIVVSFLRITIRLIKKNKKIKGRFVCLNCKTGGGPKIVNKGYVNFGAWYNHCYSTRNKNCKFDNI